MMYPIMLDVTTKKIVVVGGGKIAYRKVQKIVQAGGKPKVVAPVICSELAQLPHVCCVYEKYQKHHIQEAHLIFACTDSAVVNQQVAADAETFQWVNQCGDKTQSDFFNVAEIEQEPFWVGASSNGASPKDLKKYAQSLQNVIQQLNKDWQK